MHAQTGPESIIYIYHSVIQSQALTLKEMFFSTICNPHMYEHYETEIVLNSNLMIPDFPHIIEVRLAALIAETANRAETLQSQDATKKI